MGDRLPIQGIGRMLLEKCLDRRAGVEWNAEKACRRVVAGENLFIGREDRDALGHRLKDRVKRVRSLIGEVRGLLGFGQQTRFLNSQGALGRDILREGIFSSGGSAMSSVVNRNQTRTVEICQLRFFFLYLKGLLWFSG